MHLEQPLTRSRLRPRAIDPANISQKLKQLLKPIDRRPLVVAIGQVNNLNWEVARA